MEQLKYTVPAWHAYFANLIVEYDFNGMVSELFDVPVEPLVDPLNDPDEDGEEYSDEQVDPPFFLSCYSCQ